MIHLLNINRRWSLIFVSVQFVPLMTTIDVLFSKFFHRIGKTIFSRTKKWKNSLLSFFFFTVHIFYKRILNCNVINGSMLCKLRLRTHLNLPMEIFTIPHRFVTTSFSFLLISRGEKRKETFGPFSHRQNHQVTIRPELNQQKKWN